MLPNAAHMPPSRLWDVFCTVIDNHGDLGVCWRLARQLDQAGQRVRLWVDDASALSWMAPVGARQKTSSIEILPWAAASRADTLQALEPADVWIEAFGCELPEPFVAHAAGTRTRPPVWINLEYLSAEAQAGRNHGLLSPIMSGPAKGWTKRFFYPGLTPDTGGLLRETGLMQRQLDFERQAWRRQVAPALAPGAHLVSLFCYEPPALPKWLQQLSRSGQHLLVTPGRALAAVQEALPDLPGPLRWSALPYRDQDAFDQMLWGCDLNFVRGEDSLVRAIWAGQALVWHLYPQHDGAHHAKLEAFLDWLEAPESLRRFHRVWNDTEPGPLPLIDEATRLAWGDCVRSARQRLLSQPDLLTGLLELAQRSD
jgi:uncharacterized repeat protein (TIGR03837 family)